VDSASIVGGSLHFRITNGWNFDPLRPGGAQTGLIGVSVVGRDARPLGFAALFGTDYALPPGSSISHSLTFTGTPTTNPVLRLDINSPEGGAVRIDGQSILSFVLTTGQLVATDVKVTITPTMPSKGGRVVLGDKESVPLAVNADGTLSANFTATHDGFYRVELDAPNGERLTASPQYTVDLLSDLAPTVKLSKPGRDTDATPVEEQHL
jgi:hypothetical protein